MILKYMHDVQTRELLRTKLLQEKDRSQIKEIIISALEVHEPDHAKSEFERFLAQNFPDVRARIIIAQPKLFCECGFATTDLSAASCPSCHKLLKYQIPKGIRFVR